MGIGLFVRVVGVWIVVGVVLATAAVLLLRFARGRDWLTTPWTQVLVIVLAFACFGAAQALGGSGFISCFVGGMLFGALLWPDHQPLLDSAEGAGKVFGLVTWVLFGAAVFGPALGGFSLPVLAYALLSLTIVRMLPVFLCLVGLRESTGSKLFMGWFGPRGLASIVFLVMVLEEKMPHAETLSAVVCWTVLLSVLLHGLTAIPFARAFGARSSRP